MPLGDGQLLLQRIAGHFDDLHAVEQRPVDGVGGVGGGDEQHARKVERRFQIVVAEVVVLRRVEGFQKRGGGIAAHIAGDLVHLVEQKHRVHGSALADGGDEPPRHGRDIGAPVAAYLGLVVDAAQRHLRELAPQRARHGTGDGGLAHARRADETEDGAL